MSRHPILFQDLAGETSLAFSQVYHNLHLQKDLLDLSSFCERSTSSQLLFLRYISEKILIVLLISDFL